MPLQQLQRLTSSTDFNLWMEKIRRKKNEELVERTKLDWYLAQIAYEIRLSNNRLRDNNSPDFQKFFHTVQKPIVYKTKEEEEAAKDRYLLEQKYAVAAMVGLDPELIRRKHEDAKKRNKGSWATRPRRSS